MHCSLVKSCSPRRASPGILLAPSALQATAAPTAITRTMNIAGLLFNPFEAGHENVDPEPLVPVQLLAVPIPAPLGVPLYVLLEGKGKPSQRLVVARGPRTVGDEERSAGGELGSDAGHPGQDDIDGGGGGVRVLFIVGKGRREEGQQQEIDVGVQGGAVVLRHGADALAAVGRPESGQGIVAAAEIVLHSGSGVLVVEEGVIRLEPERGHHLLLGAGADFLVVVEVGAEVVLGGGGAFIVDVEGEFPPGTDGGAGEADVALQGAGGERSALV